ncbi:ABC1 kinase family protein [Chloroflexota bacterium]
MINTRYYRIIFFFAGIINSLLFWDLLLPRIGFKQYSKKYRSKRLTNYASSFRSMAIDMGGVMIKVGQFLSTRVDVLPIEITTELAGLQDEVPPVEFVKIKQVIESEFGGPIIDKFEYFSEAPLAAASLGQVHLANIRKDSTIYPDSDRIDIPSGDYKNWDVAVKIQRPNIESIIEIDLAALRTVSGWISYYRPIKKRVDIAALVAEFTKVLYQEIDYFAEGKNAETFATNFKTVPNVRVPYVIWTHTTKRVLTLENVYAIKINDYKSISSNNINRTDVATRLLQTYFKQIFEDGFFHADPHPGNLFVNPLIEYTIQPQLRDEDWELTFVDFGMVGTIPENLRNGLREMLIAIGTRDSKKLVLSFQTMDILLPNADLELLERAEEKAFERFWGKNMSELSSISMSEMNEFAEEFRQLIYDMPFQVPQNVIFLVRAVGILSGMCTGLDPEYNFWDQLSPFANKLIAEQGKPLLDAWLEEFRLIAQAFISIPPKMDTVLNNLNSGKIAVQTPGATHSLQNIERSINKIVGGIIFAALMLGGTQFYLAGQERVGLGFLGGSLLCLLWILFSGRRKKNR